MPVFDSLLNNSFTIARRLRTTDGQGGWAVSYSVAETVEGRIRPASGVEREVAAAEERQISHVLYVRTGADLERGDRVVGGDLQVEVLGIREPSLAGEHWEVDCLERQFEESLHVAGAYWPDRYWPARAWPVWYWMVA